MNDLIAVILCFVGCYWFFLAWEVLKDRHRPGAKLDEGALGRPQGLFQWLVSIVCLLGAGVSPHHGQASGPIGWFTAFFVLVFVGILFVGGGISLGLGS